MTRWRRTADGLFVPEHHGLLTEVRAFHILTTRRRMMGGRGTPPATGGDVEPMYTGAANQTLRMSDNFDSYTDFNSVIAGGKWVVGGGGTTQDTTTNPAGSCLVVTGRGGTGKGISVQFDGSQAIPALTGQEGHSWETSPTSNAAFSNLAKPGHTCIVQYYQRFVCQNRDGTSSGHFNPPYDGTAIGIKWKNIELWWNSGYAGRAQYHTAYGNQVLGMPTDTMYGFFPGPGGETYNLGLQNAGPYAYQYEGQWVRCTHKLVSNGVGPYQIYNSGDNPTPNNGTPVAGELGDRTAVGKMWYAGSLIGAVEASKVGVTVPGSPGTDKNTSLPPTWCQLSTLDRFPVNCNVSFIRIGGIDTSGGVIRFQCSWDDFLVWEES